MLPTNPMAVAAVRFNNTVPAAAALWPAEAAGTPIMSTGDGLVPAATADMLLGADEVAAASAAAAAAAVPQACAAPEVPELRRRPTRRPTRRPGMGGRGRGRGLGGRGTNPPAAGTGTTDAPTTKPPATTPAATKPAGPIKPSSQRGPTEIIAPTDPPPADLPKPPAGACVAETMADINFQETEVFPKGAAPEIKNIQLMAPRWFRFILRHRGKWYDGDRNLRNNKEGKNKSRAEIYGMCDKKLGSTTAFKLGDTWLMGSTIRLAPDFVPSRGYCNLMQPANHQSFLNMVALKGDDVTVELRVFENGIGTKTTLARSVTIKRGQWHTLVVKATFAKNGYYGLSVDGDEFKGVTLDTTKSGERKPPFGGNFGIYGNAGTGVDGKPVGDWVVDHYNMYYKKV